MPKPVTFDVATICEHLIAAATPLQRMIAETVRRYGRQGFDVDAIAPKIDAWFPEASSADKAAAIELGAALALQATTTTKLD